MFRNALEDKNSQIIESLSCSQPILPVHQGLESSIVDTISRYYNLILRPDGAWQAMFAQFVDFKGKK